MMLINGIMISDNTINEIKESKLLGLVMIGGIIMLYKRWRNKAERIMRKNNLTYGDKVIKIEKDPFGRTTKLKGTLVKREGVPKVLLDNDSRIGAKNIILWDEEFKKLI